MMMLESTFFVKEDRGLKAEPVLPNESSSVTSTINGWLRITMPELCLILIDYDHFLRVTTMHFWYSDEAIILHAAC
jgi:hypothetical protein